MRGDPNFGESLLCTQWLRRLSSWLVLYKNGPLVHGDKWRKLPACGVTIYRKLEAYATNHKGPEA
jgi:hypothetical protein